MDSVKKLTAQPTTKGQADVALDLVRKDIVSLAAQVKDIDAKLDDTTQSDWVVKQVQFVFNETRTVGQRMSVIDADLQSHIASCNLYRNVTHSSVLYQNSCTREMGVHDMYS